MIWPRSSSAWPTQPLSVVFLPFKNLPFEENGCFADSEHPVAGILRPDLGESEWKQVSR